jgi:hypothetical protein
MGKVGISHLLAHSWTDRIAVEAIAGDFEMRKTVTRLKNKINPHPKTRHDDRTPVMAKTTDNKGRVVLGGSFANRQVIIQRLSDTEVVVKLARVIPESEAWLYDNPKALNAVRTGLAQARTGKLAKGPDLDADAKVANELED